MSEGILRHSRWDALLIALSFVHAGALVAMPSIAFVAIGLWWNSNTVAHYFIHLPFFRSSACNRLYSVYLTLLLGFPQSVWKQRHLAHHSGRSVRVRIDVQLVIEAVLLCCAAIFQLTRSPEFFLRVYLPGYAAGLGLCFMHGYFEHANGTRSNYGYFYNAAFFNDGYHVEHHCRPTQHWTRLRQHPAGYARTSGWPAVLRWIEVINLENLERLVVRSPALQKFMLRTHEGALRRVLLRLPPITTIKVVGGGMFPRTALLLQKLIPAADITIIDANPESIETARGFLDGSTKLVHEFFDPAHDTDADLIVIPLSFMGDRKSLYTNPPAKNVLVHDWIWANWHKGVVISPWLLKRVNLIQR